MNNEVISDKQGIILITMFIIGTSSIQATGMGAKQDIWLAIIIGMFMTLPIIFVYARLHDIFPNKDMFDVIELCFGKFFGKMIMLIITLFILETASEVLINFGLFINTVGLVETPIIIQDGFMMLLCIWIVKKGIEIMGRWSEFFIIIITCFLLVISLLLIKNININNLKPVLSNGLNPIFKGAFAALMFPFTETLPFTIAFSAFKRKKSPYKVYIIGLLLGLIFILAISLINILVLGVNTASSLYHPTYFSVARINIKYGLQRVEVVAATIFSLGAFIKISVYLLGTCRGFAKLFGCKDYRFIVIPIALLILNTSHFITDSIMYFYEWTAGMWNYYALVFQIIFPIIIWIVAEIKKKGLIVNQNI